MHGNRTRLRQELEKQRQELERQREENDSRHQREMMVSQQTPSMEVPSSTTGPNQVTIEVPTTILEVSFIACSYVCKGLGVGKGPEGSVVVSTELAHCVALKLHPLTL